MTKSNRFLPIANNEWLFLFFWATGGIFIYMYLQDIRPKFLDVSVPAIASTYLEKRYFTLVKTNLTDELGFLSLIIGMYILVFNGEHRKELEPLKYSSFIFALRLSLILWALSYLFFYGYIIFALSIFIFPFFTITYYLIYKWTLYANQNALKSDS